MFRSMKPRIHKYRAGPINAWVIIRDGRLAEMHSTWPDAMHSIWWDACVDASLDPWDQF